MQFLIDNIPPGALDGQEDNQEQIVNISKRTNPKELTERLYRKQLNSKFNQRQEKLRNNQGRPPAIQKKSKMSRLGIKNRGSHNRRALNFGRRGKADIPGIPSSEVYNRLSGGFFIRYPKPKGDIHVMTR